MSECSSSQVDDASKTGNPDWGVIVDTICSSARVAKPGIPYRWATWYIDSADADCGAGVGCECGSAVDAVERVRCLWTECG